MEFINSASNKQIRGLAKFVYKAFKILSNLVWPTGNHSICAYTFELFMLLLTFCSCFVWFHALVTDLLPQSLATNGPALLPRPLTCGVSSECLGTRSYETMSRDQRGKIEMFFSSTGACTAAKFPIANHYSQINTQLYSASLIRHIWQQRYSDSEFDAL